MFLTLQQIKKSFGQGESKVEVLKGIDLAVEQGEFCVLLGPSGSGKSTLLKIIVGELSPDSGEVVLGSGKTLGRADGRYEGKTTDYLPEKASWLCFPDV